MIESVAERDLPEIRALFERLQLPIVGVDANIVFLLTTAAERFFPKFGFEPVDREQVPPSVGASVEFQSACPASAIVMRKQLR
jgi:amino-acid N-acetyltransferase